MEPNTFKELDPTKALADLQVLDSLIAADAPKEATSVTQYITPDAAEQLKKLESVQDIIPIIQQMLEWEAANKGKKCYPKALLRQQHIIAFMLACPFATGPEICRFFSIGPSVLANVMKSDTFKAAVKLHQIKIDNIMPDLNEQLKDTLHAAISVVQRDVVERQDPDFALQVLDKTANRLGMGTKQQTNVQINNNVVTPDMIHAARAAHARRLENNGG